MWPRFGIKIGNSTLCIAAIKSDGKVDVIANKQGDRVSEACVLWDGVSEIECGLTAKQKMSTRPKQAVAYSLQFLRKNEWTEEEEKAGLKSLPCDYDEDKKAFVLKCSKTLDNGDNKDEEYQITPFNVKVKLFQAELELAKQYHDGKEHKPIVVLSMPSYYSIEARETLAKAAEQAGFHVAQVLSEPTAALLGYKIGEDDEDEANKKSSNEKKYVLTIKSGGLFSHFALYCVEDGFYTLIESFGPFAIGGKQFTEVVVQYICDEFHKKYKLDPHESRRSIAKIRTNATNSKHILSAMPTTQIYIDSLMDGFDFNSQMSRARFEMLIQPVINNFMQILNSCVEQIYQIHPEMNKLDTIVLLGATMEIPKLQATIGKRFPEAELLTSMASEEIVAIGCARQALYLIEPSAQELESTEECLCTQEEFYIWHGDNEANAQILFNKGIVLPTQVNINVQLNENIKESIFKVKIGDQVNEISLAEALENLKDEEVCRLEASIENDSETDINSTIIKLRCL